MHCLKRFVFALVSVLGLGIVALLPVQAQNYPGKPVRFIIPFPPGGPTDILGRVISQRLAETWNMQVIADNRPGAGGNVGTALCAQAPPDGYTMCMISIAQTISRSIYPQLGFDPVKDFAHVTLLATLPSLLLVHSSLPVRSVKELIALAKARPGALNYASGGSGTSSQMLMELFKRDGGIDIVHVPYKGTGPALIDQLSGQIEVAFSTIMAALPYAQSGRLRMIAVSTKQRFPRLLHVPTIDESGLKGFDGGSWQGLIMPAGTAREVVSKVNADLVKMLKSPAMKDKILTLGGITIGDTPDEFTAYTKAEVEKWAKVVKAAGIHGE